MGDSGSVAAVTAVVATGGSCTPTDQPYIDSSREEDNKPSSTKEDYSSNGNYFNNKLPKVPSHVQSSSDVSRSQA